MAATADDFDILHNHNQNCYQKVCFVHVVIFFPFINVPKTENFKIKNTISINKGVTS